MTLNFQYSIRSAVVLGLLLLLSVPLAVSAQTPTVISDNTFDDLQWDVYVFGDPSASEIHEQVLSGGNSGAYRRMVHELPPVSESGAAQITTVHILKSQSYYSFTDGEIISLDYSEDLILLNLPWEDAFVFSYLAIRQGGRIFQATTPLTIVAQTTWTNRSLQGLTANDFVAFDGEPGIPDFSINGEFIYFGYLRNHFREGSYPPFPSEEVLQIEHGIDNFQVTINKTGNRAPVANDDIYVVEADETSELLNVTNNDYDPDGDFVELSGVTSPPSGEALILQNFIVYGPGDLYSEGFNYFISDGSLTDTGGVTILIDCGCGLTTCLGKKRSQNPASSPEADSVDLDLLRAFRDQVMKNSEHGARYVDMYYDTTPEIAYILILGAPSLGTEAISLVELLQPAIRNVVESDGSALITQEQINALQSFLTNLSTEASSELQQTISDELARLGPLQNYVGMTISQAVDMALGDEITAVVNPNESNLPVDFTLSQNYPNPFNPTTVISYSLPHRARITIDIFNTLGQNVATLKDNEPHAAGTYEIRWDGNTTGGTSAASGIYFYRLKTDDRTIVKKMLLVK